MNICIVGNSRILLDTTLGKHIDQCDVVVRMNCFQLKGYENHVGTKTDIVAVASVENGAKIVSGRGLDLLSEKTIWCSRPARTPISSCLVDRFKLKVEQIEYPDNSMFDRIVEEYIQARGKHHSASDMPSTGIVSVYMALQRGVYDVFICGFDPCGTGDYSHYWEPHVLQRRNLHSCIAECQMISRLLETGKVQVLV